jgi:hypothetical protein
MPSVVRLARLVSRVSDNQRRAVKLEATGLTGNVLDMTPFLNTGRYAHLAEVEAYWHAKRPSGHLPARADLDPRGISGALDHCFIAERLDAGMFRLRLAGTVLNDLMGMEVRGMSPTALFAPHYEEQISALFEAVCARPAILQADVSATRGNVKPMLEGRLALWPLRDDDGFTTRLLGGLSYRGDIGRAPRALQVVSHRLRMLQVASALPAPVADSVQDPSEVPVITQDGPEETGFAEATTPFSPAPKGAVGRARSASRSAVGHLRLVSVADQPE